MLNAKPYRVIMKSLSPVVISGIPPSLDGVLYEAISQVIASNNPSEVLPALRDVLLFNEALGVFHASSLRFGITPEQGVSAATSVRCDYFSQEKLSSAMFSPKERGGKYSLIRLEGGPTKKRLTSRPAYSAPYLTFDFAGDADAVEKLLTLTHVGVGYDYFSAANGEFTDVRIIPLDEDISISSGNVAVRPVPDTSGLDGVKGLSPLIPPYFHGEKVGVVYPEPVRFNLITTLL
ncbi:TPA: hypothetical protein ACK1K0_004171 [Klebsiella pneumoniae]